MPVVRREQTNDVAGAAKIGHTADWGNALDRVPPIRCDDGSGLWNRGDAKWQIPSIDWKNCTAACAAWPTAKRGLYSGQHFRNALPRFFRSIFGCTVSPNTRRPGNSCPGDQGRWTRDGHRGIASPRRPRRSSASTGVMHLRGALSRIFRWKSSCARMVRSFGAASQARRAPRIHTSRSALITPVPTLHRFMCGPSCALRCVEATCGASVFRSRPLPPR
jgi:hypothetical protein